LRCVTLLIAIWSAAASGALAPASALAQPGDSRPPTQTCPPDGDTPTVERGDSRELSDKLAKSKGVVCPPGTDDREIQVVPPTGGKLKVIPPPGSPGGDQSVQPK